MLIYCNRMQSKVVNSKTIDCILCRHLRGGSAVNFPHAVNYHLFSPHCQAFNLKLLVFFVGHNFIWPGCQSDNLLRY